jgi:hypothetical protein
LERVPEIRFADLDFKTQTLWLGKTFRFYRHAFSFELRAEAFNVSNNYLRWNDPNGSFGSAPFGSITSAGNPRVFELVGKVHF